MSLINEALKRTRDASYQPAVALPPPPVAADCQSRSVSNSRGLKSGLLAMIVIALVAVVGVIAVGLRVATGIQKLKGGFAPSANVTAQNAGQITPPSHPVATPVIPVPVDSPAPAQAPVIPAPTPTSSSPAANSKTAEDELVGRLMEKIKAEQAASAPKPVAVPPKLILQGITSAADGNEAMINGVSLREGEDIEGARIVTIERRAVRLDFGGREIVLRLP
jgi:hypothetical protein